MGGHALEKYKVYTVRKNSEEMARIAREVMDKLLEHFSSYSLEISPVKSFRNKDSHGDLDLLYRSDENFRGVVDFRKEITELFHPKAIHHNGNVFSFDYDNFQIDLIHISNESWETANAYYSYDPIGNIMGKIAHKMNVSYGWDGLKYKYRNFDGRYAVDIPLSNKPSEIFEFLGFNYSRFLFGFDTIEDIFEYIISSDYFNEDIFKMENLNHIDKKRNKKRASYKTFLDYINNNQNFKNYEFPVDNKVWIEAINSYFPEANLIENIKFNDNRVEILTITSKKFSGKTILELYPNLEGKEVGKLLGGFRNDYMGGNDNYFKFLMETSEEEIKNKFIEFYNQKNKKDA